MGYIGYRLANEQYRLLVAALPSHIGGTLPIALYALGEDTRV